MSYSNDTTHIKAGMINYVGALVQASKLPAKGARQDVAAMLIEEALKLARNDDDSYDMYVLKPLLRAVQGVAQSRIADMDKQFKDLPDEIRVHFEATYKDYQTLRLSSDRILTEVHKNAKL